MNQTYQRRLGLALALILASVTIWAAQHPEDAMASGQSDHGEMGDPAQELGLWDLVMGLLASNEEAPQPPQTAIDEYKDNGGDRGHSAQKGN